MPRKSSLAIGAAVVGVAAGFIAGVLTAPKSGKETRADIKSKAGELKNGAEHALGEAVDRAGEAVDSAAKTAKKKWQFWR